MEIFQVCELLGSIFGFVCVFFYIRRNIWSWPTGLVQVLLFVYVFYSVKLYSDMLLHIVFIFLQIYGWRKWLLGKEEEGGIRISRLGFREVLVYIGIGIFGTGLIGFAMSSWTDASFPYPDAFGAVFSLIAQWLIARKVLENWLFWIAVNLVSIIMYLLKNLYSTSALYILFLGMAIFGFISWSSVYRKQNEILVSGKV